MPHRLSASLWIAPLVAATAVVVAVRAARWIGNQSARSGASPSARGLMRVYLNTRIAARAGDAKESGEIYEDSHGRRNVALSCSRRHQASGPRPTSPVSFGNRRPLRPTSGGTNRAVPRCSATADIPAFGAGTLSRDPSGDDLRKAGSITRGTASLLSIRPN